MKLVTYQSEHGAALGVMDTHGVIDLAQLDATLPKTMLEVLSGGQAMLDRIAGLVSGVQSKPITPEQLLAPISNPGKIFCIGLNYQDHAEETGREPPGEPVVFNKFPSAIQHPERQIVLPKVSPKVDFEAELVVVMGKSGRHISEAQALDYVAGYCCGHDVSARDWQTQKPGGQWLLGKTFDTFAPLGPFLATRDEIGDASNLGIKFRLNGRTMQDSNTSQLIFPIPKLIAYISQVVTLAPGDLIFTGTPAGVGVARKPPVYLQSGDVCEVEIEHLGVLRNPVVAEA